MCPRKDDEAELVRRAVAGDEKALEALYRRYVGAVYRFMYYRTGDRVVAEDLTADVFAAVLKAIPRYEERGLPFGAWLFRIARAQWVDYRRKEERRKRVSLKEEVHSEPPLHPSQDEILSHLYFASLLSHLTDEQREVVLLRFIGGLSHAEIAEVVGSNPNAVKAKLYRALQRLRATLRVERQAEEGHEGAGDQGGGDRESTSRVGTRDR